MGSNKFLDNIVQMALLENTEQRDNNSRGKNLGKNRSKISPNTASEPLFYKHVIDLRDEPISLETFKNFDPNVRSTQGFYQITCLSKLSKRYVKGKPFFINQDLLRLSLHVQGKEDWHKLCKRIPELGWLERNSTLTDELFDVAAKHCGMGFIFTVKWTEYSDMINEKARKRGMNINDQPFVTHVCSYATQEEYDKKYLLAPKKDWQELQPIINEVDNEIAKSEAAKSAKLNDEGEEKNEGE